MKTAVLEIVFYAIAQWVFLTTIFWWGILGDRPLKKLSILDSPLAARPNAWHWGRIARGNGEKDGSKIAEWG